MKIIELHIENFGKLHDFSLSFNEGLNIICKENGFGKTTLASFVKAMLYGMAKKGNNKEFKVDRSRYKPWQGGVYGGSITFTTNAGTFKASKTFGDTPEKDTFELIDLQTGLKSEAYSKNLGYDIFNVGIETYEITAFFPQLELISSINDETRANLTGAEKFENDLNSFAGAQKLLSDKLRQIKKEKSAKGEVEELQNEKRAYEAQFDALQKEEQALKAQLFSSQEELTCVEEQLQALDKECEKFKQLALERTRIEKEIFQLQEKSLPRQDKKRPLKRIAICSGVLALALAIILTLFFTSILSLTLTLALGVISLILYAFTFFFPSEEREAPSPQNEEIENKKRLLTLIDATQFDDSKQKQLQEKKFSLVSDIAIAEDKIRGLTERKERCKEEIEEVEQEIAQRDNLDKNAQKNEKIIEKTLFFMKKAQENVSARYLKPMQEDFEKYFSPLSNLDLKLDVDYNINITSPAGSKDFEFLSQGLKDIVSICKRFALIDSVFKNEKPVVVMDDPFVNLDDKNLSIMKQVLKNYDGGQILLLSCSEKRTNS